MLIHSGLEPWAEGDIITVFQCILLANLADYEERQVYGLKSMYVIPLIIL